MEAQTTETPARTKGLTHRLLNELTVVANVKPGHEKQIREGILDTFVGRAGIQPAEQTASAAKTSLHDARTLLLDNDTRFILLTSYEGDWDKYFDDHFAAFGRTWNRFFEHCEGVDGDVLVDNGKMKDWLYAHQVTAVSWGSKHSGALIEESLRALEVQTAFHQVVDHPDAARAFEHPA